METKICKECHIEKSISDFYKWQWTCKECYLARNRERNKKKYYENLEESRARARERRRQNPELWNSNYKKWAENNKEYNILRRTYYLLRRRCNNPNDVKYPIYGGRWIKCERPTLQDFLNDMSESFYQHVKEYWTWRKNTQIDRIDNNWNYNKDNCRWVTALENNHNRIR